MKSRRASLWRTGAWLTVAALPWSASACTRGRAPAELPAAPVARPFTAASYWNTPFRADAPVDPNSARWIADSLDPDHGPDHLQLTGAPGTTQSFATPIYRSAQSDPVHTIVPAENGEAVEVRIPDGATPAGGSDGQMTIFDTASDQVVGLSRAERRGHTWAVRSTDRYILSSNGLAAAAAGSDDPRNGGHRGVPASVRAVRVDEVEAGVVDHRLECFWSATADAHVWPMSGHETNKGGIVPEGAVIRIKPSVDLVSRRLSAPARVLALALQDYGCLVGDNSGGGNRLKLERNERAWRRIGLTRDALSSLPWNDWEFVQAGYDPQYHRSR